MDGSSKRQEVAVHSLFSGVLSCFLLSRCEAASLYVLPVYFSLKLPPLFQTDLLSSLSFSSICFLLLSSCFSFFPPLVLVLRAVFIGQMGAGASLSPSYCCAWGAGLSCLAMAPG
jgi:hypothetical protein